MPTKAGGTGAIGSDRIGNHVTELASGRNSHGGGQYVVSEKWMERFVINLDVLCSDGLASGDDPAGGSSDVGSDVCVVPDPLLTAVSMWTVVAEKWMDRFVLDLVECPSVSRTSAVARTFGPAVSEEYSPVVFCWGGGGCRCIPPGCSRVRYSASVWPTVG